MRHESLLFAFSSVRAAPFGQSLWTPHFLKEFLDVVISFGKGKAPFCRGAVAPLTSAFPGALLQISPLGQPMQQGIERARADRVTVPSKLLDEAEPVNVFPGRVTQHMKLYQAAPKIPMAVSWTGAHRAEHISRREGMGPVSRADRHGKGGGGGLAWRVPHSRSEWEHNANQAGHSVRRIAPDGRPPGFEVRLDRPAV